jgi:hypothetical protein
MKELVGIAAIFLAFIVLDLAVFAGRYERLLLNEATNAATTLTTDVAEFFSHNLRRG